MTEGRPPLLGVVIPTLDEAERLPLLLADLERLPVPHRTVVVDGGSRDGTRAIARSAGVEVLHSEPGRARQMNAGRSVLETPWLLFLHADSRLGPEAGGALAEWLDYAHSDSSAYFGFRLEGSHWFWRFIEVGQRLRERLLGLPYGDQGILVSATTFRTAGGFPEVPLLEDVEFLRRVRHMGPVERLPAALSTSPRRYQQHGRWTTWLQNTALIALHSLGASPSRLSRWVPNRNGQPARAREPRWTLIVFAKAPRPGKVKTRLAEELGAEAAARIYRGIGRRVIEGVRGGPYRIVVYYDPPDAECEIRDWLGEDDLGFRPQSGCDLGVRMDRAFRECFEVSDRVCIVGTDAPDVDRFRVEEAFRSLDTSDVVFGPALDGGYYLLALAQPCPELFESIPWSTSDVLRRSEDQVARCGLRARRLQTLRDIDTVEDLNTGGPFRL